MANHGPETDILPMVLKERGPPTREGWCAHRICGVSHRENTEGKLNGGKPGSCWRREAGKTARSRDGEKQEDGGKPGRRREAGTARSRKTAGSLEDGEKPGRREAGRRREAGKTARSRDGGKPGSWTAGGEVRKRSRDGGKPEDGGKPGGRREAGRRTARSRKTDGEKPEDGGKPGRRREAGTAESREGKCEKETRTTKGLMCRLERGLMACLWRERRRRAGNWPSSNSNRRKAGSGPNRPLPTELQLGMVLRWSAWRPNKQRNIPPTQRHANAWRVGRRGKEAGGPEEKAGGPEQTKRRRRTAAKRKWAGGRGRRPRAPIATMQALGRGPTPEAAEAAAVASGRGVTPRGQATAAATSCAPRAVPTKKDWARNGSSPTTRSKVGARGGWKQPNDWASRRVRQPKDVEEPRAETRATRTKSREEDRRPEEGRWLALDGRRATIESPKIGLGMNSCFT